MTGYHYGEPSDWQLARSRGDLVNYLGEHPAVMALQDDDRLSLAEQAFMVWFLDKRVPVDTPIDDLFEWLDGPMRNLVFEEFLPTYFEMLNPRDFRHFAFHDAQAGCFTPFQLVKCLQVYVLHLIAVTVSEELGVPFEQVLDAFDEAEVDTYGIAESYPRGKVSFARFFNAALAYSGR